jgi:polyisoprenyl-teichoic acid--peptidoglycan teichoic acid transferase
MGIRAGRNPRWARYSPAMSLNREPRMATPAGARPARRSAGTLLVLNAIFPGLGHLVAGSRRWALVLALPVFVIALLIVVALLGGSVMSLGARIFDPAVLTWLLVVQVALLLWRLGALAAVSRVVRLRANGPTLAAGLLAVAIIVGPQALALGLTAQARDAAAEVYQPAADGDAWVPTGSAPPVASGDPDFGLEDPSLLPSASASESPSAAPAVPRVNVLLIGVDSGRATIHTFLTDTMIVASLDPVGKTVSMVSIPRDMVDVPLPDGRTYRGKINGLVSFVRLHPGKFPGAKDGQSVLAAALGELLGLKINKWAQVNLTGFVSLVDAVGGIDVNVTDGFCDPGYTEFGINGFSISPGRYHFDGEHALAYARVRKAAGESDFTRAARQQEVVAALRDRVVKGGLLENPTKFLRGVGQTITTNVKPSFIADWIDIAIKVGRKDTFRVVMGHPYVAGAYDERGSIQKPNMKKIRSLANKLFTDPGVRPKGFDTMPSAGTGPTKHASSSSNCGIKATPRPTPKATKKPTPKPTAKPTAKPSATPKPTAKPTASPEPTKEPTPEPTAEPTTAP